jgi:hypothetical protein
VADEQTDNLDTTEDSASELDTTESTEEGGAGLDDTEASAEDTTSGDEENADATGDVDDDGSEAEAEGASESERLFADKFRTTEGLEKGYKDLESLVGTPEQVEYRQFLEHRDQFEYYRQQQAQAAQVQSQPEPPWNPPVRYNEQMAQHLMAYEMALGGDEKAWNGLSPETRANVERYAGYVQEAESLRLHNPVEYFQKYQMPLVNEVVQESLSGVMARINATAFVEANQELVNNPEFSALVREGMSPERAKELLELRSQLKARSRTTGDEQRLDKKRQELRGANRRAKGRQVQPTTRSGEELSKMPFEDIVKETEQELANSNV